MSVSTSIFDVTLDTIAKIKTYLGGDSKQDAEPVHDSTHDLSADDWNRIVAGLAEAVYTFGEGGGGGQRTVEFTPTEATPTVTAEFFDTIVIEPGDATPPTVVLPAIVTADLGKRVTVCSNVAQNVAFDSGGSTIRGGVGLSAAGSSITLEAVSAGAWAVIAFYLPEA